MRSSARCMQVATIAALFATVWGPWCRVTFAEGAPAPPRLDLARTGAATLAGRAEFLVDPHGMLQVEDLRATTSSVAHTFRPLTLRSLSQGLTSAAYWVRVRIANPRDHSLRWTLLAEAAYLDHLDAWVFDQDGTVQAFDLSDRRPFGERAVSYRALGLAHATKAGGFSDLYVRVAFDRLDTMHLGFRILPEDRLSAFIAHGYFGYGLLYGAMLVLAVYALIVWSRARDSRFGYYAAYVLCTASTWMAVNGHLHQFLLPNAPELVNVGMHVIFLLTLITALLFTRCFLRTAEVLPRIDQTLLGAIAILSAGVVLRLLGLWTVPLLIAHAGLALLFLLIFVGIAAWRRGITYARWYVAAWTVYGGILLLNALHVAGAVSWLHTGRLYPLAQALNLLEIVMLAIAQADRMRLLQREQQAAERRYRELLERQNEILERRVGERTHELASAWEQAREESETDEVTGLGNRRFFLRAAEQTLAEPRSDAHQAIAYFDLDGFKAINDAHGHPAGDAILQAFASTLGEGVREGDVVARFGGDEFVLLLASLHSVEEAQRIVERIGERFRERPTTHEGTVIAHTVSAGIAARPPAAATALRTLLARADLALYAAKDGGRDQVAVENGGREAIGDAPQPA